MVAAYLAIPFMFWFIQTDWYGMFIISIPVYAFLVIPIAITVGGRDAEGSVLSIGALDLGLFLLVYCIGHIGYLALVLRGPPSSSWRPWPSAICPPGSSRPGIGRRCRASPFRSSRRPRSSPPSLWRCTSGRGSRWCTHADPGRLDSRPGRHRMPHHRPPGGRPGHRQEEPPAGSGRSHQHHEVVRVRGTRGLPLPQVFPGRLLTWPGGGICRRFPPSSTSSSSDPSSSSFSASTWRVQHLAGLDRFILVANHNSHLDILLLFQVLPLRHLLAHAPRGGLRVLLQVPGRAPARRVPAAAGVDRARQHRKGTGWRG